MDTLIKIIPFLVGCALGVVGIAIILKFSEGILAFGLRDIILGVPAIMVILTGAYIVYRAAKDLGLKS